MIKSELVGLMAQKMSHVPEEKVQEAASALLQHISDHLAKNNRIEIRDFGSFELRYHAPRNAHNPKTGQRLVTEPKYIPHFKPGKELRQQLIQAAQEGIAIQEDTSSEADD